MKPYGRTQRIMHFRGKRCCHPKKLGRGWVNWWETMCTTLTRSAMKHNLKKQIDEEGTE